MLRIRIRDPVPFWALSGAGIRDGKYPDPGSGIRDVDPRSYFAKLSTVSVILINTYLNSLTQMWIRDPGSCQLWIRDGKNRILDPEYGFRDKHPGSSTLLDYFLTTPHCTWWCRHNNLIDILGPFASLFINFLRFVLILILFVFTGMVLWPVLSGSPLAPSCEGKQWNLSEVGPAWASQVKRWTQYGTA